MKKLPGFRASFALVTAATLLGACSSCGRGGGPGPSASSSAPGSPAASGGYTFTPAPRDPTPWARAKDGDVEDLAYLARVEGAAGLVEAAAEPALAPTAVRAMRYATGWAQGPFLAKAAAGDDDVLASEALESLVTLATRPRVSEDVEDKEELEVTCQALVALASERGRAHPRRVSALRAWRMMPCPKADVPADLDAR